VALFRKKETLNEQLLREAGLDRVTFNMPPQAPIDAGPLPGTTGDVVPGPIAGSGGRSGPMDWDTVTTVAAPGIDGDRVEFVALPGGDLVVTDAEGDGDFAPFADAIEEHVSPPYKAIASRQDGDLWGVGGKRIEVAEFVFPDADGLELSQRDGVDEFLIDGSPTDVAPPLELRRLGENAGADFFVAARRIDGDYWEVMVNRF
jgi:hypothetical protein